MGRLYIGAGYNAVDFDRFSVDIAEVYAAGVEIVERLERKKGLV